MSELYHATQLSLDFSVPAFEHTSSDCNCNGKRCYKCSKTFCILGFNRNRSKKDGRQDECRDCTFKMTKRYRQTNGDAIRQRQVKYHKDHPQYRFIVNIQKNMCRYGLTSHDYFRMDKEQNSLCAICKRPTPNHKIHKRLSIDHDHLTGKVRGLLCHKCNTLLGAAEDDIETLRSAIAYLEKAKEGTN